MKNSFIISESEKKQILGMHESFVPKRYREKTDSSSIPNLINQFIDELNFQKQIHLHTISMLDENQRAKHISNIYKNHVSALFSHNQIVSESYLINFNSLLTESTISFSEQIDRLNNFLVQSLLFDTNLISEQFYNPLSYAASAYNTVSDLASTAYDYGKKAATTTINTAKQVGGYVVDKAKQGAEYVANQLTYAVDYIKKNGLGFVFENLRKALLSMVGTAIQVALSFTGAGAIVNEVAWGIMTLYDAYQYFVNSAPGSLANLIIDLICLLTAGSLGKVLSKFVGTAGTSISAVLQKFMSSGVGQAIKPVLNVISSGASTLSSWLGQAAKFMADKMGITWVAGLLGKVVTFFKDMAGKLSSLVAPTVAKAIVRVGVSLGPRFESAILGQLAQKSEQEIAKLTANQITKAEVKLAEKYANEYLKEKPTEEALAALDKQFGTKMGDAYALYLNSTKLASHTGKLTSGAYDVADYSVDAVRGDATPGSKTTRLASQTAQATTNLLGVK